MVNGKLIPVRLHIVRVNAPAGVKPIHIKFIRSPLPGEPGFKQKQAALEKALRERAQFFREHPQESKKFIITRMNGR